jgi:flagella basal body P-ring formation protein FlgA
VRLVEHTFGGTNQVMVSTESDSSPAARPQRPMQLPAREKSSLPLPTPTEPAMIPLQASGPVVVAVRSVPRGVVIQASDVQLQHAQPVSDRLQPFRSLEQVIGKQAAQPITAGRVIDRSLVRQPLLVEQGDIVTVYARAAGVQVRTQARARDNGSLGELIAVESLADRKSYFARVSGIQEAVVDAYGENADRNVAGAVR